MSAAAVATCVIIDNNAIDLYLLAHLVGLTEELRLVASFADAHQALGFLQAHAHIDLLLLDVEMPGLSGLELMRQLPQPHPTVIIISSYRDFDIEAFDLHVADYLLKPVEYGRFQEAIRQLQLRSQLPDARPAPASPRPCRRHAKA
jgi:two-component system LytT family response regulator